MAHLWFLGLLLICSTTASLGNITITVGHNGVNAEDCLTGTAGSTNCSSLDYVLNNVQQGNNVTISVEYNHKLLAPVNVTYTADTTITVTGKGLPTVDCDGAYVFIFGQPNNDVSLTIDSISWYRCQGEGPALVGFAFDTLQVLTLANVHINNCSDMVIRDVISATVTDANFTRNIFRYAVITFTLSSSLNGVDDIIVTNELSHSSFSNNLGYNGNNTSTVAYLINSTNNSAHVTFVCSDSTFVGNRIIYSEIHDNEVFLLVPSGSNISSLEMSISRCFFRDSIAHISHIVYFFVDGLNSQRTKLSIQDSFFLNNTFEYYGNLISIYIANPNFTNSSLNSLDILFSKNIAHKNRVAVGFQVEFVTKFPGTLSLEINESTFEEIFYGPAIKVLCDDQSTSRINMSIKGLLVFDSHMVLTETNPGLVDITYSELTISNSGFIGNIGTPLSLTDCKVWITGSLEFRSNVGKNGGAMSIYKSTTITAPGPNVTVLFMDNSALYGGAMYINSYDSYCFIDNAACNINFTMINNSASTSGSNIFVMHPTNALDCVGHYFASRCASLPYTKFGSAVSNITLPTSLLSVSPGESIFINANIYDAFSNPSTCTASVYLQCQDKVISCGKSTNQLKLEGPTRLTLSNMPFYSNLILLATSYENYSHFISPQLVFQCEYTELAFLNLKLKRECGLGFVYNSTTYQCECAYPNNSNGGYICSQAHSRACVAQGVWYGQIEQSGREFNVVGECQYPLCTRVAQECPEDHGEDYVLLPSTSDEQCSDNRGGILCRGCSENATFSFEAIQCVANSQCKPWQPYVTLLLVVLFQLFIALFIEVAVNIKLLNGLGFLYGPLFYLAVINHLPFSYYAEYYRLNILISVFTSVFLLDMELFGHIEWCFFGNLSALENYAFHYIGPIIVGPVLLLTVCVARRCPRLQKAVNISPLQSISLLSLLSFWALANTSIRILRFHNFGADSTLRVRIQPDLTYFTGFHLLLSLVAIAIIVFLIIPFTLTILFAPLLMKRFSLIRLRPFLDELQSSYHDKYRWFPALYMISWMTIVAFPRGFIIAIQVLLVLVLSLQFFLQPYRQRWLNIINTFLVFDLIMVASFLYEQDNPSYISGITKQASKVLYLILIYILVILPLLYITGGGIAIAVYRLGVFDAIKKRWRNRKNSKLLEEAEGSSKDESLNSRLQSVVLGKPTTVIRQNFQMQNQNGCREPLLVLLQEEEGTNYGTYSNLSSNK